MLLGIIEYKNNEFEEALDSFSSSKFYLNFFSKKLIKGYYKAHDSDHETDNIKQSKDYDKILLNEGCVY